MRNETIILNQERNVTLTTYLQDVGGEFRNIVKRPAILIIPGGGYAMCSDREAEPVVWPYLKAGFQAFVLRYSVKQHAAWPNPLNDYDQAMELIRTNADEWNLYADKVAVIGFSAGGHLAGCAATMSRNRPNAAILGYAEIGEGVDCYNYGAPNACDYVDDQTCPCFIFSTRNDAMVSIRNSINFMAALDDYDIAFESHIYSFGPHGFSTCDSSVQSLTGISPRVPHWVDDSAEWLKEMFGDFGSGCLCEPQCNPKVNGDRDPYLSADCTLPYLMKQPQAVQVLKPLMEGMKEQAKAQYGDDFPIADGDVMPQGTEKMKLTLRDALSFGFVPQEVVDGLDMQLRKIPNTRD